MLIHLTLLFESKNSFPPFLSMLLSMNNAPSAVVEDSTVAMRTVLMPMEISLKCVCIGECERLRAVIWSLFLGGRRGGSLGDCHLSLAACQRSQRKEQVTGA